MKLVMQLGQKILARRRVDYTGMDTATIVRYQRRLCAELYEAYAGEINLLQPVFYIEGVPSKMNEGLKKAA